MADHPTHLPHGRRTAICEALIVDAGLARRRTAGILRQTYRSSPHWSAFEEALEQVLATFDTGRTAAVAETSTRVLLDLLGWRGQILSSSRLPARPGRSQRLADLAAATGARAYLCGTGGMKYLQPQLFTTRSITVTPFTPPPLGIWAAGHRDSAITPLMALGPAALADEVKAVASRDDLHPAA
ncbi:MULTISPECIES: WbqC family protein [unclassified Streptomyces]|uniref:WbqC family protein n=1 Tax=unclassified Streptomyces TaxID=2593676 RepID=UPI002E347540|nr:MULTISPECIES: WbqC family protein [unclassified Streptomyces]